MQGRDPGTALKSEGGNPLVTIASRAQLPPRVRLLLESVLGLTGSLFERQMASALTEFEQHVVKLAEKSHHNHEQQGLFESLRTVRYGRGDVTPRFLAFMESALARFDHEYKPDTRPAPRRYQDMSLVETFDVEESVAVREIATAAEFRHSHALSALGYRFGVLAGSPALDAEALPVGPQRLTDAMRYACADLSLPLEHRRILYRLFDRLFMADLGVLYGSINDYLIEKHILRFLQDVAPRLRVNRFGVSGPIESDGFAGPSHGSAHGGARSNAHGDPHGTSGGRLAGTDPAIRAAREELPLPLLFGEGVANTGHAPSRGAANARAPVPAPLGSTDRLAGPGGSASVPAVAAGAASVAAGVSSVSALEAAPAGLPTGSDARRPRLADGSSVVLSAVPRTAPASLVQPSAADAAAPANGSADAGRAPDSVDAARDGELFRTLRELLRGRVPAPASSLGTRRGPLSSYTASHADLESVLGSLQSKPVAPVQLGGRMVQRSVEDLKHDLLNLLRQLTPDGRPPQLDAEDSDTVDLVGMLFDFIARDTQPNGATQSLLTRLQVPVLRVALRDKGFFTRRNHPARQLLNAIAETGKYWVDDVEGDVDRALVEKMQLLVDQVAGKYDGKVELFDEMLNDLSGHMATLAKRSEVAERRHVDAAKGRERLEVARERAVKVIAERLEGRKPERLVRSLLEQAWVDVLALTLLRHGEDSAIYRNRLAVADQLLENTSYEALAGVRNDLEQGLLQVGLHTEDVQEVVHKLVAPREPSIRENPSSRTELTIKLRNKAHLGDDTLGEAGTEAATRGRAPGPPLSDDERRALARLQSLPFGTMLDFTVNQQGDVARRKLSWYSTVTGRALFVNQRGARADERPLEQLARDLVRGQVRIVDTHKESLIDRAWHAVESALRQFSGPVPGAGKRP